MGRPKGRYSYKLKGRPGFKLLRKILRSAKNPGEAILMMNGAHRKDEKRHPGYPKMGDYTKQGFKLTPPKHIKK